MGYLLSLFWNPCTYPYPYRTIYFCGARRRGKEMPLKRMPLVSPQKTLTAAGRCFDRQLLLNCFKGKSLFRPKAGSWSPSPIPLLCSPPPKGVEEGSVPSSCFVSPKYPRIPSNSGSAEFGSRCACDETGNQPRRDMGERQGTGGWMSTGPEISHR